MHRQMRFAVPRRSACFGMFIRLGGIRAMLGIYTAHNVVLHVVESRKNEQVYLILKLLCCFLSIRVLCGFQKDAVRLLGLKVKKAVLFIDMGELGYWYQCVESCSAVFSAVAHNCSIGGSNVQNTD